MGSLRHHFLVGNIRFHSELDAFVHSKASNKQVQYVLGYDFIDKGNWETRPLRQPHEYFDEHSRILKDRYEKIILMYSGGTDSHTILDSFIRVGIRNVTLFDTTTKDLMMIPERLEMQKGTMNSLKKYVDIFKELNYDIKMSSLDSQDMIENADSQEYEKIYLKYKPYLSHVTLLSSSFRILSSKNDKLVINNVGKTAVVWGFE